MENVNNTINFTTTNVNFSECRKSQTFGSDAGRYDLVFVYSDGIAGLAIMGCSNSYSLTVAFTDKEKALDTKDKFGDKGLPCDVVGVTIELPDGIERNVADEWKSVKFVRFACPKGNEEQCAKSKLAQILRQCTDENNTYWRIVEQLMNGGSTLDVQSPTTHFFVLFTFSIRNRHINIQPYAVAV